MVGQEGSRWAGAVQQGHSAASSDWAGQAERSPLVSLPGQRQSVSLLWVDQGSNGGVFFSSQYQGWLHSLLIILNCDLGESSYLGCHNHFISNEEPIIKGNWLWVRVQTVQSSERAIWINWSLPEILREAGVCLDFDREKGWRRQEAKPAVRGAQFFFVFFFNSIKILTLKQLLLSFFSLGFKNNAKNSKNTKMCVLEGNCLQQSRTDLSQRWF